MSQALSHASSPILIVPYMWIGDFVRCHTVVRVLKERWPDRPVDVLSTTLCAPLADYMPGVRRAVVWDLPRGRLALGQQRQLAAIFRANGYGDALIMPRTWKSVLAPFLAGIPNRTGFVGEVRFGLLNDWRWGEKALPRMVDLGADKCIPCKMMAPILEEMKTAYAGQLEVEFIDVWKNPDAGSPYGVRVIPTQIFFDAEGEELFRHEGFYAKEDMLAKWKELGVDLVAPTPQTP